MFNFRSNNVAAFQAAHAAYKMYVGNTMRTALDANYGVELYKHMWFLPVSANDGVFNEDWRNKIEGSVRYKVNDIIA